MLKAHLAHVSAVYTNSIYNAAEVALTGQAMLKAWLWPSRPLLRGLPCPESQTILMLAGRAAVSS